MAYQHECERMSEKSPAKPDWLKKRTDLIDARERIARVRKANDELREVYSRMYPVIQKELAAEGVSEGDRPRLAAAILRCFEKTKSLFAESRGLDDGITKELLRACDLLDDNWAKWHFDADTGAVVFDNDDAAAAFNAIQVKVQELAEKQRQVAEVIRKGQHNGE